MVHGLADARLACTVARELGVTIELHSAPDAAASLGPGWFLGMVQEIERDFPDLAVTAVLDCGDAAGYAQAALRSGIKSIRFTGKPTVAEKIKDIARKYGAGVVTGPGRALRLWDRRLRLRITLGFDFPDAPVEILQHDIFTLPAQLDGSFDYMLEYTCYCAIDPKRRAEFADLATDAGWRPEVSWCDADDLFSLHFLRA